MRFKNCYRVPLTKSCLIWRGFHLLQSTVRSGVQLSCVTTSPAASNCTILRPTSSDIALADAKYDKNSLASQTFLAGRCALRHTMLTAHNINLSHIPKNHYGVPLAPVPISLSHKNDLALGATLQDTQFNTTIGIDLEVITRPYTAKQLASFQSHILTAREKEALNSANPLSTSLLTFSIKEAVYKAVFPHYQRFIGFREVEIKLSDTNESRGRADVIVVSENKQYIRGSFEVYWELFSNDYWMSIVKYRNLIK